MSVLAAFEREPDETEPITLEATIASSASSISDVVDVIIPSFSVDERWEGARWMPRVLADGTPLLPDRGDAALVVMSDDGTPWILAWWPYA